MTRQQLAHNFAFGRHHMATPEEIFAEEAAKPEKVRTTSAEIWNRPLMDLIEWDRYLASKKAYKKSRSALAGLRITKANPPGTV